MAQTYIPRPVPAQIGDASVRAYLDRELQAIAIQFQEVMQVRYLIARLIDPLVVTLTYQELVTEFVSGLNVDRRSEAGYVSLDALFNLTGTNANADITIGFSDRDNVDPLLVIDGFTFVVGNRNVPLTIPFVSLVANGLKVWGKGSNVTIDSARFVFAPMTAGGN